MIALITLNVIVGYELMVGLHLDYLVSNFLITIYTGPQTWSANGRNKRATVLSHILVRTLQATIRRSWVRHIFRLGYFSVPNIRSVSGSQDFGSKSFCSRQILQLYAHSYRSLDG